MYIYMYVYTESPSLLDEAFSFSNCLCIAKSIYILFIEINYISILNNILIEKI